MTYPELGTKVSYVRQNHQGEILTGQATVMAICVDGEKRLTAHLKDTSPQEEPKPGFNVPLTCLNPTKEFIEKFTEEMGKVEALVKEASDMNQEIVKKYNAEIAVLYTGILGEPLVFENTENTEDV